LDADKTKPVLPKELLLAVDAKDADKRSILLAAWKCKENICLGPLDDVPISSIEKFWSN
jgi:hypothetical protein